LQRTKDWVRQALLVPTLRAQMEVRKLKRGYATIYAVTCSPTELAELSRIRSGEIANLAAGIQHYLDTNEELPRIRVLCFGSCAALENTPQELSQWLCNTTARGAWLRRLCTAVARFTPATPIRRIIVHELTHALLDLLTNGFPYPVAIAEGFARRAEYLLPNKRGMTEWQQQSSHQQKGHRANLTDDEFMSVRELLCFDARARWTSDRASFLGMTNVSFWLNVYLFKLSGKHPILKRILPELRLRCITTGEGVYSWLQEACSIDHAELEDGFYRFCTKGTMELDTTPNDRR